MNPAIQEIYQNPLKEKAKAILGQHLKLKSTAQMVAETLHALYEEGDLVLDKHEVGNAEPQLICSLGLQKAGGPNGS